MSKFDVMINEDRNIMITVEAENVDDAKAQATLKYLNKDFGKAIVNTGFSVQVVAHPACSCNLTQDSNNTPVATYC